MTFDRIRSGSGAVGAVPYLNCFDSSVVELVVMVVVVVAVDDDDSIVMESVRSKLPDPVDPTNVTELKFDGDDGPLSVLSVNVSRLVDVAMVVDGMDRRFSDWAVAVVISIVVVCNS